jgi:hypothetical protein
MSEPKNKTPSDPTADRREIVARIIGPNAFIIVNSKPADIQNRQELAMGTAERIIAALGGP